MDSESNQNKSSSDNTAKAAHSQVPSQNQVRAMSAQQIISGAGNVNMLEGRTIRLNLFTQKKT